MMIAFPTKRNAMVNAVPGMFSVMENAKALIFNAMESALIKLHRQQIVMELAPGKRKLGFVILNVKKGRCHVMENVHKVCIYLLLNFWCS